MRTTSNPKTPFLRACIGSMPPIRPDVSWRSCASSFPEISLTSGTRTLTKPGPTSGFAPSSECHLTLTGGRRWTMDVKALAVIASIWSPQDPTATRTKPRDRSFILGAQSQTRSNILKAGTGFDAQKQFLSNVEDAIASPVDIPVSIARYQINAPVCINPNPPPPGLRVWNWALPVTERHGTPSGKHPGL